MPRATQGSCGTEWRRYLVLKESVEVQPPRSRTRYAEWVLRKASDATRIWMEWALGV